uniref:Uncharacterized protein n=1 Tax=Plectus sambesii TaxID=2011161 RepID=A0A914V995_9BILA
MRALNESLEVDLRPFMGIVKIFNAQLGFILACLLIYIAFAKDRVHGQYKWYLTNCSVSDMFCCVAYAHDGVQTLITGKHIENNFCTVTIFLHIFAMGTSFTTLIPVVISR